MILVWNLSLNDSGQVSYLIRAQSPVPFIFNNTVSTMSTTIKLLIILLLLTEITIIRQIIIADYNNPQAANILLIPASLIPIAIIAIISISSQHIRKNSYPKKHGNKNI